MQSKPAGLEIGHSFDGSSALSMCRIIILIVVFSLAGPMLAHAVSVFDGGPLSLRIRVADAQVQELRSQPRKYVPAQLLEGTNVYQVGIHLKGQYGTFKDFGSKPSLTVNVDKIVRDQKFHGLDKFHLNNSASDPSYMTELLCRGLFRDTGMAAARVTHARVELNGRDAGLFVVVEGHDKTFLRHWFTEFRGNLYDSEFMHDVTEPLRKSSGDGPDDRSDLRALTATTQIADPAARLNAMGKLLNLEEFYSFLALETVTCHVDGYAQTLNNYWLYHDPASGKFYIIPHGMDQMFHNPRSSLFPELKGTLASAVLETARGRKDYWDRCGVLYTNLFTLSNRVVEVQRRIRPMLAEVSQREAFKHDQAVEALQERIAVRIEHLREHLRPIGRRFVLEPGQRVTISDWLPCIQEGKAQLPKTSTNATCRLGIEVGGTSKASRALWEARIPMGKGVYRIATHVQADYPVFRGPESPVDVKIWGGQEVADDWERTDAQNLHIAKTFVIQSDPEEEVIIQLIARSDENELQVQFHSTTVSRLQ